MKTAVRSLPALVLLAAAVLWWAHHSPSVETILIPLTRAPKDFNILSAESEPGAQPILLIVDMRDSNVYSRYVAEILKTEGMLCFESIDLSSSPPNKKLLEKYSLVITATSSSTLTSNKELFFEYVHSGGALLMVAPPVEFDSLLGIRRTDRRIADGYILFDSTSHVVRGLSRFPLQFFGDAQVYQSTRASVVAHIAPDKSMAESHPAAGNSLYGAGRTGFIAYNLGQSIVVTRQGRPPLSNNQEAIDRDNDGVFKIADLYYDSYDYANRSIPQADEQQKLFVNLIFDLLEGKATVPRVWYFPRAAPAVALLTGDHHGWGSQQPMSDIAAWLASAKGHYTFFVYPDQIDSTLVHNLVSQGHTISPHLYYPVRSNRVMRGRLMLARWFSRNSFFRPRLGDLESEVDRGSEEFEQLGIGHGRSTRLHYLIWWGWTETPQLLALKGYALDLSISGIDPRYGHRPNVANDWNSPMGYGYVNGSGQPMKVITPEGNLVDLFCQLTQFEDDVVARECLSVPPSDSVTTRRLMDLSMEFIDQSISNYHTVLAWNFHPEHTVQRWPPEAPTTGPWIQATVKYLQQRHVPMLSADEWLSFVQARRSIEIGKVKQGATMLTGEFSVNSELSVEDLTLMVRVPAQHSLKGPVKVSSTVAEEPPVELPSQINVVNGIEYLVFQIDVRAHRRVLISFSFM